jgi:hypothetical protein
MLVDMSGPGLHRMTTRLIPSTNSNVKFTAAPNSSLVSCHIHGRPTLARFALGSAISSSSSSSSSSRSFSWSIFGVYHLQLGRTVKKESSSSYYVNVKIAKQLHAVKLHKK